MLAAQLEFLALASSERLQAVLASTSHCKFAGTMALGVLDPQSAWFVASGAQPEHPGIHKKSRFSADRKSSKTLLFGYETLLLSRESAQAWPKTPPILFLGPEDEIPGGSWG